jgi:hypothetical protein
VKLPAALALRQFQAVMPARAGIQQFKMADWRSTLVVVIVRFRGR